MSDAKKSRKLATSTIRKFLILFHPTKVDQAMLQWDAFVGTLLNGNHLIGGSALAKPSAIKNGKHAPPKSASVGGYIVITASSLAKARALMKKGPTHLCGGLVEVFPLVMS